MDTQETKNEDTPTQKTKRDFIFYLFDEKGGLKVLTTIDRALTSEEFELVEQSLAAYKHIMGS